MRLPDDPNNPKKPPKPRKPQYSPIPDDQKKVSGRPRKYDRVLIKDDYGNDTIVCVEVDKHRYWFISYVTVSFEKTFYGSLTFETKKNLIFSLKDIQDIVGNRNLTILYFYEFKDKVDYEEFNRAEEPINNNLSVILT